MNGARCRKSYCRQCLEGRYNHRSEYSDWNDQMTDGEWHCPGCLGFCECPPCSRQRGREQARAGFAQRERDMTRAASDHPGGVGEGGAGGEGGDTPATGARRTPSRSSAGGGLNYLGF